MEKTFRRMRNPKARRAYVEAEAASGLAHQIRAMRTHRGWTQKDLADKLGTTQAAVSRLEDASYGRQSIKTLLDVSAAFDVALQVRFISFVRFLQATRSVSREQLEVEPFEVEAETVGFHGDAARSGYLTANVDASSARFVRGTRAVVSDDGDVELVLRKASR